MSGRFRSRGVTLVELALVLAIIGIVLGAYLSRVQNIAAQQPWEDAEKEMAGIREAIVLYAAKNKTAERMVTVVDEGGMTVSMQDILPSGRPVLPCPDVNGDGVEDRQKEGELPSGYNLTITLQAAAADQANQAARIQRAAQVVENNPLLAYGNCVLQKGALPWRSLPGVSRSTDPWGNLYTYRVDSNFSNRLIGFDEHTRADIFDARFPFKVSVGFVEFRKKRPDTAAEMYTRVWTRYRELPLVVRGPVNPIAANERPSIVCQRPPCPPRAGENRNEIVGGLLAESRMTVITSQPFGLGFPPARVRRIFEAPRPPGTQDQSTFDIVEGLPFVVVSHGREDRGAWLPPNKAPASADGSGRGVFMAAPFNLTRASDVNNALDFGVSQIPSSSRVRFESSLRTGGLVLADTNIEGPRNWGTRFRSPRMDNGFTQPRGARVVQHGLVGTGAQPVHDDVVTWMTADELSRAAYHANILPAPPLPPFGIPK